jgi:hypothetical protein
MKKIKISHRIKVTLGNSLKAHNCHKNYHVFTTKIIIFLGINFSILHFELNIKFMHDFILEI